MEIESFIDIQITPGKSGSNTDKIVSNLDKIDKGAQKTEKSTKRARDEFGRYVKKGSEGSDQLASKSTKANDKIQKNQRKSQAAFKQTGIAARNSGGVVERASTSALRSIVAYTVGVVGAGAAIRALVTDYRDFETGLIGVAKTTGLAGDDLRDLAIRIDDISTKIPVSTNELLELAQAAGQMGVTGTDNLEKFAVTVAKLGRASDLAGEDAAKSLARILNVTNENIDSIDVLASVLVSLGNQVAATESEIARMTTEVARATSIFGISSAESAGLAAAMSSIGVQAALGGSSVGRAMRTISEAVLLGGDSLDTFTRAVGLNSDELKAAWAEDKVGGLMMFLEGLNAQGEMAAITLTDIGLGGQQAAKTILPLANNIEILERTLGIANKEVENATALNREFEATLKTFDSQWIVFKNGISSASRAIGGDFMPEMTGMISEINTFLQNGGVEIVADGARSLAKVVMVGGSLYLGLAALTGIFGGVSVSAGLAAGNITAVSLAANVLMAAFAGWEIGSFLSENFAEARVVGMAFVVAMMNGFERLKFAGNALWETFSSGFDDATSFIKDSYADLLGLLADGFSMFGAHDMAAVYENFAAGLNGSADAGENLKSTLMLLEREMDNNIATNNQLLEDTIDFEVATDRAATATEQLTDEQENLDNQLTITNREVDTGVGNLEEYSIATMDVLDALAEELHLSGQTERAQMIYNAIKEAGVETNSRAADAIRVLVNALEDETDAVTQAKEATREYEKAQKEAERESARASKQMAKQWLSVRDTFSGFFVDLASNGKSAFVSLRDSFKAMLLKMVGDLAASKLLQMFGFGGEKFGVQNSGGILGGNGGFNLGNAATLVGSAGTIGTTFSSVAGMAGFGTLATTGGWVAPSMATSATLAGAGGAGGVGAAGTTGGMFSGVGTAISAIPVWGWALAAAAVVGQLTKNPDGYTRSNSGFLLGDTSNLKRQDRLFGVDDFDSGLSVTGFNRRTDRGDALNQINIFRSIDTSINDLVLLAGGKLNTKNASISGLNEDGRDGTTGTFFGIGGKTKTLDNQINSFASQLGDHITGLEAGILQQLADATGFNDIITVLESVILSNEELAATNVAAASSLTDYGTRMRAEINARIDGFDREAFKAAKFVGDRGFNLERDLTDEVLDRAAGVRERLSDETYVKAMWDSMDPATRPADFHDMMTDGSHATGLARVPFNNYKANLHMGESVKTKAETDIERSDHRNHEQEMFTLNKNMGINISKMRNLLDEWTRNGLYTVDTPPS